MEIREELPSDVDAVEAVHRAAFPSQAGQVAALAQDLRRSLSSQLGLSLVAVDVDDRILGHVLFTQSLLDAPARLVDVQVLSPVGVRPDVQGRGIGGALVRHGIEFLDKRGVAAVFLEGSPDYYARFGFKPGTDLGFRRPSLRIPEPAFQVLLLSAHQPWMTGTLVYRHEFWDHDAVGLRPSDPRWQPLAELA